MKNKKCLVLAILMIFTMCFSLFGCGPAPDRYKVNVNVWYSNYGTTYGGGTFDEGSTVTINATPKQNSKFIAWMKENIVVSREQNYSFKINKATTGTYTAIFSCPELELATVKGINFTDEYEEDSLEFAVLNAEFLIGGTFKTLETAYKTDIDNATDFEITDIVYALNCREKIPAKVILTYTTTTVIDEEETEVILTSETLLELQVDLNAETLVTEPYKLNLPTGIKGDVNVKFTFEKLAPIVEEEEEE